MVLDIMFITAYLGINALIWVTMYGIGRDRTAYEKIDSRSEPKGTNIYGLPRVSIVVPLYLERPDSIMRTAISISKQRYPRGLLEVVFVVEESDTETLWGAETAQKYLLENGIRTNIYIVGGRRSSKARALNAVLKFLEGEIIAVYDADDILEEDQVSEAVKLMTIRGYDAVGVRVYRYGESLLGKLIYIDTVIWYDLIISFLRRSGFHTPLSGEGLYIRKKILEEVGGFPEKLAEDAYLSLILFEKGYRIGLLDSYVEEAAPKTISSHLRQRIRWYRGHLECITRIIFHSSGKRLRTSISYISPIIAVVSLLISIATMMTTSTYIARGGGQGDIYSGGQSSGTDPPRFQIRSPVVITLIAIFIESAAPLAVVALTVFSHRGSRDSRSLLPYTILLPLYWILISVSALPAMVSRNVEWYRTRRA
jgi:cellulose synthase/poly-beta-1,6-N-acetylglucosamine synthase-like glycosyltransferase